MSLLRSFTSLTALLLLSPLARAQEQKEPEFPPFEKAIEGLTKVVTSTDGPAPLYDLYADKKAGKLLAVLPASFGEQELMIACTITSGHPEAGVMGPTFYGSWRRMSKQLAFVVPDVSVRSEGDAHARAAVSNLYSDTLLVTLPILALAEGSRPVIDLARFATVEGPRFFGGNNGGYGPTLAGLQAQLASLVKAKAFPNNVVIEFEAPQGDGRMVRVAYSLGKLEGTPGYQPRTADNRVGFFYDWYVDTTPGEYDEKPERFIDRWNVEKADASLALSPPKEPIVWYVEHTTPIKYRRYVREGIELWNEAFAKIGIAGALEVYQQDATTGAHMEKDPEDSRYNFFRWNMSEAGYAIGPSRSNPKTGEILDADVVWNQGLTRAVGSMLGTLSKSLVEDTSTPELLAWYDAHPRWDPRQRLEAVFGRGLALDEGTDPAHFGRAASACHMGHQLAVDLSLVGAAFDAGLLGPDDQPLLDGVPEEFLGGMIRYIAAHEVGHCLGLQHNMAASNLVPLEKLGAADYQGPVSASVMDYVAPNLAGTGAKQSAPYINAHLGPYDMWAIACGYGPADKLEETLAESCQPEHTYVSQIAMSFGADPRNMTWDVGANNLDFCEARMKLVAELRGKLTSELVKDGEPWAEARRRYQQILGTQLRALSIAAVWIGGSFENLDAKGTPGARLPVADVPAADQRRALAFIEQNCFDDGAFGLTPELVRHMGKEYWYDPHGRDELTQDASFSVHDLVGSLQAMGLSLLLNPTRLRRVHDNEFRTAGTSDAFTLAELLTRVTDSVWKECKTRAVEASYSESKPLCSSFRRNLQWEHAGRLIDLVLADDAPSPALRAITTLAAQELRRIDGFAKDAEAGPLDPATKAHLAELRARIGKALDAAYVKKG